MEDDTMSNLAHYLQNSLHDENIMERAMNEIMRKEYNISNDIYCRIKGY